MSDIDRKSPIPLYRQVADILREQILSNELDAGDPLPTEDQLAYSYGLSRVTVRKSLELLANEGLIIRQPGKGTFVEKRAKVEERFSTLRGFAELMVSQHPDQIMEILDYRIAPSVGTPAQALNLSENDRFIRIKRRHKIGVEVIACAIIFLPYEIGKNITIEELTSTPVYNLLERKIGLKIDRAYQSMSAISADEELAKTLEVTPGWPLMAIRRVTYSTEQTPVEYILLYYRGDRIDFTMELFRNPQSHLGNEAYTVTQIKPSIS